MMHRLFWSEIKKITSLSQFYGIISVLFLFLALLVSYFFVVQNPATKFSALDNRFDTVYITVYMIFNISFFLWGILFVYSSTKEISPFILSNLYPIRLSTLLFVRFLVLYILFFCCVLIAFCLLYVLVEYKFSKTMPLTVTEHRNFIYGYWMLASHFFILILPFLLISYVLPFFVKSSSIRLALLFLMHISSNFPGLTYNPFRLIISAFATNHAILTGNHLYDLKDLAPKYVAAMGYVFLISVFTFILLKRKEK